MPVAGGRVFALYLAATEPREGFEPADAEIHEHRYYLAADPLFTERDVADAKLDQDTYGRPCVVVELSPDVRERFAQVTREHLREHLAIVVQGKLLLAPRIEGEVSDGRVSITGAFTRAEMERLAQALHPR